MPHPNLETPPYVTRTSDSFSGIEFKTQAATNVLPSTIHIYVTQSSLPYTCVFIMLLTTVLGVIWCPRKTLHLCVLMTSVYDYMQKLN